MIVFGVFVVCTCQPSYLGSLSRRIMAQTSRSKKCQTLLEKYLKQKVLRAWLKSKVLA
jgi:hypothetical protein